jgi:hypothetical protein
MEIQIIVEFKINICHIWNLCVLQVGVYFPLLLVCNLILLRPYYVVFNLDLVQFNLGIFSSCHLREEFEINVFC